MKQAMGFRLPFDWEHVWACLAISAVGVVVAVITAGTNISATPVVRGSAAHWAYISLVAIPAFLVLGVMTMISRHRREVAPFFWRESRQSWFIGAVAVPLYLGFAVWLVRNGLSAGALTACTLFLSGLFPLMTAIADRSRRYFLGWGVSTVLVGAIAPLASYGSAGLLAGGWLRPRSTYRITSSGRKALSNYLEAMQAVIDSVKRNRRI